MKRKKIIKDDELKKVMRRVRGIVGPDILITFRTTKTGSKLIGTWDDDWDDEGDEEPDFNFPDDYGDRFERKRIKGIGNKKQKLTYIG